jgi:hypothetical protein
MRIQDSSPGDQISGFERPSLISFQLSPLFTCSARTTTTLPPTSTRALLKSSIALSMNDCLAFEVTNDTAIAFAGTGAPDPPAAATFDGDVVGSFLASSPPFRKIANAQIPKNTTTTATASSRLKFMR